MYSHDPSASEKGENIVKPDGKEDIGDVEKHGFLWNLIYFGCFVEQWCSGSLYHSH